VDYKSEYSKIQPYTTKDGSIIRELFHPNIHGNMQQSLAESTVQVGTETLLHKHVEAEELYHIIAGKGFIVLGDAEIDITVGDTVCILPGTAHKIRNTGEVPLRILCCCSPAYSHEDTELI
jgi:mannose-6-phosphate isomerase-like protein (cupin superfamily)